MSKPSITRATPADLELRGSDGRTIAGIAVPFDSPARIRDLDGEYVETFDRHAFDRTLAERGPEKVKFLIQHEGHNLPVGRAVTLRPEARGLFGEFHVSKTERGDELLELVKDGAVDALSVGFRLIRDRWSPARDQRRVLEAALNEVSAVGFPAYEAARIEAVRAATQPNLLAARRRLLELKRNPS